MALPLALPVFASGGGEGLRGRCKDLSEGEEDQAQGWGVKLLLQESLDKQAPTTCHRGRAPQEQAHTHLRLSLPGSSAALAPPASRFTQSFRQQQPNCLFAVAVPGWHKVWAEFQDALQEMSLASYRKKWNTCGCLFLSKNS